MRRVVVACVAVLACQTAPAIAFKADPDKLCIGELGARRVDPDSILWELFKKHGLTPNDLAIGRKENSYDLRVQAILDPRTYCTSRRCGGADLQERVRIERSLYGAQADLVTFWNTNLIRSANSKFHTGPRTKDMPPDVVIEAFFREAAPAKAVCIDQKQAAPANGGGPSQGSGSQQDPPKGVAPRLPPPELRIRKSAADLGVSQADEKFAGLDRASFAFSRDYLAKTDTYNFDGVVGLASPSIPLDRLGVARFNVIPYVGFTRQVVQGSSDPNAPNVQNLKGGAC